MENIKPKFVKIAGCVINIDSIQYIDGAISDGRVRICVRSGKNDLEYFHILTKDYTKLYKYLKDAGILADLDD